VPATRWITSSAGPKKAFAALWAAIANEYGLPLYRYNQI
jgi:hypothetical protein